LEQEDHGWHEHLLSFLLAHESPTTPALEWWPSGFPVQRWIGCWRLVSLDGGSLDVADEERNLEAFGRSGASRGIEVRVIEYEIEGALAELKTHLRGSKIVLRRKTPELVRQEFYGLLIARLAIRGLMHEPALEADHDPDRLSHVHAVRVIRRNLPRAAAIPPRAKKAFHRAVLRDILVRISSIPCLVRK
jgi:hypothetical protein